MDVKEQLGEIVSLRQQVKELNERIDRLETQNALECGDINDKLSTNAQQAIENSKGPLKPNMLLKLLMSEIPYTFGKFTKGTLKSIRQYSANVDGLTEQLLQFIENVQTYMTYRKKQQELDTRLIKLMKKLIKRIDEEKEKEAKSNAKWKKQSTLDQYLIRNEVACTVTPKFIYQNNQNLSVPEFTEESVRKKQSMSSGSKRKHISEDEMSNRQENGLKHIASRFSKRLKLCSSDDNTVSSQSTDVMSVSDECNSQHTEPMSIVSSENSQAMSVGSPQGSHLDCQPMSVSSQEGSRNPLDAMSIDDPEEAIQMTKIRTRNFSKKKQVRLKKHAQEYASNGETISERRFHFTGKPLPPSLRKRHYYIRNFDQRL